MSISSVRSQSHYTLIKQDQAKVGAEQTMAQEVKTPKDQPVQIKDGFFKEADSTKSLVSPKGIYGKPTQNSSKMDKAAIHQMMEESERRIKEFRELLQGLVLKQGAQYKLSKGKTHFQVSSPQAVTAQQSIEAGGEYSVDAVAGRIMDMAVALAGDDKSKIAVLKGAVKKGFEGAEAQWGSDLPEISNQTYDEVMRRFEQWEKGDRLTEIKDKTEETDRAE